ncbi:hypothetical protein ACFYYR_20175 [Streptomyces sp. NPDC001922]|uniref:hypothetical protein n=1 Tax=Streptomyces sp. NPDC001922 TaxID=3364624 RepID=UPI0036B7A8E1
MTDRHLPRELKVVDTASLLALEEEAQALGLSQGLKPEWVAAHAAPAGLHCLCPAIWHSLRHRPELPRHLRCELLIELRSGERVMSLLDVLPDTFAPLPRARSRDEAERFVRLWESASSVRDWEERRADGPARRHPSA